jgi:hypothetical protein
MKKLIAVLLVLLLAAPAMAADWSFYGSQRMSTFYNARDFGDFKQLGTGFANSGYDDDWGLTWDFQGNSRIGARVKADKISGQIELALGQGSSNAGNGNNSNGGDGNVGTRRAYGIWKFADGASLKIGKDYSPVTNLVSGQVYESDAGLLGQGDFYGGRPGQLALQLGGFELAFITNAAKTSTWAGTVTAPAALPAPLNLADFNVAPAGTDIDDNYPKIEARYTLKMDAFELIPFGGFQYFSVSEGNATALSDDLDIVSYVVGLNVRVNMGAMYFNAQGSYGQNWGNANWANGRSSSTDSRSFGTLQGVAVAGGASVSGAYSSASLDPQVGGSDEVNDAKSWMVLGLAGLKFSDTLKFEVGAGYRVDDPNLPGADEAEAVETYLQAVVTLAPGVFLVPEVGYIKYFDDPISDEDLGYAWYAGAKWQIDF